MRRRRSCSVRTRPWPSRAAWAQLLVRRLLSDSDWGDLDYLVMDLPPGTADIQQYVFALSGRPMCVLVVVTPAGHRASGRAQAGSAPEAAGRSRARGDRRRRRGGEHERTGVPELRPDDPALSLGPRGGEHLGTDPEAGEHPVQLPGGARRGRRPTGYGHWRGPGAGRRLPPHRRTDRPAVHQPVAPTRPAGRNECHVTHPASRTRVPARPHVLARHGPRWDRKARWSASRRPGSARAATSRRRTRR